MLVEQNVGIDESSKTWNMYFELIVRNKTPFGEKIMLPRKYQELPFYLEEPQVTQPTPDYLSSSVSLSVRYFLKHSAENDTGIQSINL